MWLVRELLGSTGAETAFWGDLHLASSRQAKESFSTIHRNNECVTILLLVLCFGFFGFEVYRILAPQPGIKLSSPALEGEVLTTGLSGKSLISYYGRTFALVNEETYKNINCALYDNTKKIGNVFNSDSNRIKFCILVIKNVGAEARLPSLNPDIQILHSEN